MKAALENGKQRYRTENKQTFATATNSEVPDNISEPNNDNLNNP